MTVTQAVYMFGYRVSPDTLVQTYGTVIGAVIGSFLAGLLAFVVMRVQLSLDSRGKRHDDIKNFLKAFYVTKTWLDVAYDHAATCKRLMTESQTIPSLVEENLVPLKRLKYGLEECAARLATVKHDFIPQEIYENFVSALAFVDIAVSEASAYLDIEDASARNAIAEHYFSYEPQLIEHIRVMESFSSTKKAELH